MGRSGGATPTVSHAAIAQDLISHGIHVLVEKPLTMDLDAAQSLVTAAEKNDVTLAVGHVERFNPAFVAAQKKIDRPTYIETARTAGFSFRSTDIGVVFDLMIHDLDLVRALVRSPAIFERHCRSRPMAAPKPAPAPIRSAMSRVSIIGCAYQVKVNGSISAVPLRAPGCTG